MAYLRVAMYYQCECDAKEQLHVSTMLDLDAHESAFVAAVLDMRRTAIKEIARHEAEPK